MSEEKNVHNTVEKLSAYAVGQVVNAVGAELAQAKTSPPPRYREDSLIEDMRNAWKFTRNEEDKAVLRETEGIGTARTRAEILGNLIRRKLITSKKVGKRYELVSTEMGRDIVGRLPGWLTDVATTAKWETLLTAIEKGDVDSQDVIDSQIAYVRQVVERAKGQIPPSK